MKQLFRNKIFLLITTTDIIQLFGIWIRNIAILFFVMEQTNDSPNAVSAITFIEMLPMVFFSLIGGVIADRYHPKKTMILGDVLSMISFIIIGLMIPHVHWIFVLFATLVSGIVSQFSYPSSARYFKAYLPHDDVDKATAFSQTIASIFPIIGPALGTFLYYTFGIQVVFWIVANLFFVSVLLLLMLPKGNFESIRTQSTISEDIKRTVQYVKEHATLGPLFLSMFVLSIASGFSSTLDIFLVTERLGLEKVQYQWFAGIAGIGMIFGSIIFITWAEKLRSLKMMGILSCILAVTISIEGMSTVVWLTLALQFLDNVLIGIVAAYMMGAFTRESDEEMIGKLSGFSGFLWYAGFGIASAMAGPLMSSTHLVVVYIFAGTLLLGIGLWLTLRKVIPVK
ncbi:MAG: MFS transporter [Bacilli bacterium]